MSRFQLKIIPLSKKWEKSQPELEKTIDANTKMTRILSHKDIKGVILKIFQGPVINMINTHLKKKKGKSPAKK